MIGTSKWRNRAFTARMKRKKANVRAILVHVLKTAEAAAPFMPFITEDIYTRLPGSEETIMLSAWPKADAAFSFPAEAAAADGLMDMVRAIRNVRAEMNVPPAKRAHVTIVTKCSKRGGMPRSSTVSE